MVAGAVCLKKPHHIIILQFSEVVKGHAKYMVVIGQVLGRDFPGIWQVRTAGIGMIEYNFWYCSFLCNCLIYIVVPCFYPIIFNIFHKIFHLSLCLQSNTTTF